MAKMTVANSKALRAECKSAGCSDDECDKIEAHLATLDWSKLDFAAIMQLVMQLIAILRPVIGTPATP
jgi:hypothetical protein